MTRKELEKVAFKYKGWMVLVSLYIQAFHSLFTTNDKIEHYNQSAWHCEDLILVLVL